MKNLIIAMLLLFNIQTNSQEIKTREDAIKVLERNNSSWSPFCIINTAQNSTYEDNYRFKNVSLENEFLIIKACNFKYASNSRECYKTKEFYINLMDLTKIKLEKVFGEKGTFREDFYYLKIISKDFVIYYVDSDYAFTPPWYSFKKGYKDYLPRKNELTQDVFDAINLLKSTCDPNEKEELKLDKLKDESTKIGVSKEITEEQRRYIVQANSLNDAKDYTNALIMYRKAVEVNKVSYPNAYFNMALIYAELNQYYRAIFAMKQYLILASGAEDARKAQDKIYEWELNFVKL